MMSLFTVAKHQLYISRRMISIELNIMFQQLKILSLSSAQMIILSSHVFNLWCIVAAWRNAAESEATAEATRIAVETKADVEDARIALVAKAESAAREVAERLATRIAAEAKADAETFSKLDLEAKADPSPSTGHSTDIYGHSQQYYHYQQEDVAFLQDLLSDSKQFLGFPRHSDGKVIPNFAQSWSSDVIGDLKKCEEPTGILHR